MRPILNRRNLFLLLLLGTTAILATACMWGVVTNSSTGTGISGATITFTDANGTTGTTTTGPGGLYAFNSSTGPVPAVGSSVHFEVSAPGFATLKTTRTVDYGDNPYATLANPSSFWDVRDVQVDA